MAELNYGQTMEEAIVNCLAANGGELDRSTLWVKIGSRYGRDALKSLRTLAWVESAGKTQSFAITKEGDGPPEFLDRQVMVSVERLTDSGWAEARRRNVGLSEPKLGEHRASGSSFLDNRDGSQGTASRAAAAQDTDSLEFTQTHGGHSAPAIVEESLGDAPTVGNDGSSISDFGDSRLPVDAGMEIVDLTERYEIIGSIGKGGMGEVQKARDTRLNRFVAIKRIRGEIARSRTAVDRFLTEAQSVAALNHFNIVQRVTLKIQGNAPPTSVARRTETSANRVGTCSCYESYLERGKPGRVGEELIVPRLRRVVLTGSSTGNRRPYSRHRSIVHGDPA